jgi:hypothetical protein
VAPTFDRRVIQDATLDLVRALQRRAPSRLAGGAALSGLHLRHRLSDDVDLFCHDAESLRGLVRELPLAARECGVHIVVVRDAGSFVRASARLGRFPSDPDHFSVVQRPLPFGPRPLLRGATPVAVGTPATSPWGSAR